MPWVCKIKSILVYKSETAKQFFVKLVQIGLGYNFDRHIVNSTKQNIRYITKQK